MKSSSWTVRRVALAIAVMLVSGLAVLHLAGGRTQVGVLSGTQPASDEAIAVGVGYAVVWFGAVLGAPILVIAALIDGLIDPACGIVRIRTWISSRRR